MHLNIYIVSFKSHPMIVPYDQRILDFNNYKILVIFQNIYLCTHVRTLTGVFVFVRVQAYSNYVIILRSCVILSFPHFNESKSCKPKPVNGTKSLTKKLYFFIIWATRKNEVKYMRILRDGRNKSMCLLPSVNYVVQPKLLAQKIPTRIFPWSPYDDFFILSRESLSVRPRLLVVS